MFIRAKQNLQEITEHKTYKKWMIENKIFMTISKLKTDKPMYAGFFTEPNPEKKKIKFLEDRIQDQLFDEEVEFQVTIVPLYIKKRNITVQVYMGLSSKEHAYKIREGLSTKSADLCMGPI
jgi:hypothetical protein